MENIVLYIVAIFFLIGAVDYVCGDKLKLGSYFADGIKSMGPLAIAMVGIISLTPVITEVLNIVLVPVADKIGIDPSIFISNIIAIDMGAFNIAENIALSKEMIYFSGVLMASMLGCTLSFTLPLALGIIKKENRQQLFIGMLFGIISLPFGLFIGGLLLKIPINIILINLIPIIIISILLSIGILYCENKIIFIFNILGKGILWLSIIGLSLQGIQSISGVMIFKNLMPLQEALNIVGKIAIFLGGAYVMLEVLKRLLENPLDRLALKSGVNKNSIAAFLGSLASAIIVFVNFEELDDKGKILCSAFSVGGAYVLGGQLGFVASEATEIIGIYIFIKLFCGFLSVLIAILYIKKKESIVKN